VKICPVDDLETLTAWQAVKTASLDHDHVALPADPIEERVVLLDPTVPHAGEKTLMRVGFLDDEPVATAELTLPTLDNLSAVSVDIHVAPAARRHGHGRDVLAAVLDETAAMGRPRVFFEAPSPYPTGAGPADALLTSVGARPVLKEVRRLLDLRTAAAVFPPAPPPGYSLVQWVDRVPDEHLDDMAYLMHRMSTDAPMEDMDWEPEVWDGARYRDKEASAGAKGRTRFGTLAVHAATGRAVAFTDIGVSRFDPTTAYQWETIVETDHRGHGLGYVVKAHNHRLLSDRSPATRWLNTWNAESNTHMVGINERLGFQPMEYWSEWQLDR
jgi:GNAT superfamily N-acetyltransferase